MSNDYRSFVYGMLNLEAEARSTKYYLLTQAVMGIISEYAEFKQCLILAAPYLQVDNLPEDKQKLITDVEQEAADIYFFITLFNSEKSLLNLPTYENSPEESLKGFWNHYRKWLYQGNEKALKKWYPQIISGIFNFDEMLSIIYSGRDKRWIDNRMEKISREKLMNRYGGDSFSASLEARR